MHLWILGTYTAITTALHRSAEMTLNVYSLCSFRICFPQIMQDLAPYPPGMDSEHEATRQFLDFGFLGTLEVPLVFCASACTMEYSTFEHDYLKYYSFKCYILP